MAIRLMVLAFLIGGCGSTMPVISETAFSRLEPAQRAALADQYMRAGRLGFDVRTRLVGHMQRAEMDPIYRGLLWLRVAGWRDGRFTDESSQLWYLNGEGLVAALRRRQSYAGRAQPTVAFWRDVQSQLGVRLAVAPQMTSYYAGEAEPSLMAMDNMPNVPCLEFLVDGATGGAGYVLGYGCVFVTGSLSQSGGRNLGAALKEYSKEAPFRKEPTE